MESVIIDTLVIGLDSLIVSLFYRAYKGQNETINNIKNAPEISLNKVALNKVADNKINGDYVMINGAVEPIRNIVESNHKAGFKGVIRVLEVKEHKSKKSKDSSSRSDTWETVTKDVTIEPFSLANKDAKVEILQAKNARYLMGELETTYKDFKPINSSFASAAFSTIFETDYTKAYQFSEEMLKTGTVMYAFGKLEKGPDNLFRLSKPDNLNCEYILTKMTREEIVQEFESSRSVIKFFMYFFGALGVGYGVWRLYRYCKKYKNSN